MYLPLTRSLQAREQVPRFGMRTTGHRLGLPALFQALYAVATTRHC